MLRDGMVPRLHRTRASFRSAPGGDINVIPLDEALMIGTPLYPNFQLGTTFDPGPAQVAGVSCGIPRDT